MVPVEEHGAGQPLTPVPGSRELSYPPAANFPVRASHLSPRPTLASQKRRRFQPPPGAPEPARRAAQPSPRDRRAWAGRPRRPRGAPRPAPAAHAPRCPPYLRPLRRATFTAAANGCGSRRRPRTSRARGGGRESDPGTEHGSPRVRAASSAASAPGQRQRRGEQRRSPALCQAGRAGAEGGRRGEGRGPAGGRAASRRPRPRRGGLRAPRSSCARLLPPEPGRGRAGRGAAAPRRAGRAGGGAAPAPTRGVAGFGGGGRAVPRRPRSKPGAARLPLTSGSSRPPARRGRLAGRRLQALMNLHGSIAPSLPAADAVGARPPRLPIRTRGSTARGSEPRPPPRRRPAQEGPGVAAARVSPARRPPARSGPVTFHTPGARICPPPRGRCPVPVSLPSPSRSAGPARPSAPSPELSRGRGVPKALGEPPPLPEPVPGNALALGRPRHSGSWGWPPVPQRQQTLKKSLRLQSPVLHRARSQMYPTPLSVIHKVERTGNATGVF